MGISLLCFQLEGGRGPSPLSLLLGQATTLCPPGRLEQGEGLAGPNLLWGNPRASGRSGSTLEAGVHCLGAES